jgi:hypothetical protein
MTPIRCSSMPGVIPPANYGVVNPPVYHDV